MRTNSFILLIALAASSICGCDCNDTVSPLLNTEQDHSPMWPQYGYNGRHTNNRYAPKTHIPPVSQGKIDWIDTIMPQASFGDGSESSIDSKGNIYHLSTRQNPKGQVIKFRPDGSIIWQKDSLYIDAYFGIALSSNESKIYYKDFNKFACIDSSGNFLWSIIDGRTSIPVIGSDGTIYLSINNKITAVAPDGAIKWVNYFTNIGICWPCLDRSDNIYVYSKNASNNYELLKINQHGVLLWNFPVSYPEYFYLTAVIDGFNNIYFKSRDSLVSVNENGVFRWSKKTWVSYTAPSITKNNLIITDSVASVIALDTAGNTVWKTNLPFSSPYSFIEPYFAIDDEDNIYFNYWPLQSGIGICSL